MEADAMEESNLVKVFALADDATGALEVGARFARQSGPVPVWFGAEPPDLEMFPASECLVIDTETRHLSSQEAGARVRRFAHPGIPSVYKKTDSTLRGNIAAEFRALLDAWPERPLVYVPAYPDLGRTVVGGELWVDGRPLNESAFAKDLLNPATEGSIPALLRNCGALVTLVPHPAQLAVALGKGGILVCDGSRNEDLRAVAEVLRAAPVKALAAGPGAFAGYWARALLPYKPSQSARPQVERCLVVNGSRHPASREQIRWAADHGWQVIEWRGRNTLLAGLDPWTVLTTPYERLDDASVVARDLGRAVSQANFDALVVFGGDTLRAICAALKIEVVMACEELLPGVPLSRAGGLAMITKAGGFGRPDLLGAIRALV
jgi:D-threonate/D-erythronate kinase